MLFRSKTVSIRQKKSRILAAAASWRQQPFVYGETDCCQFVSHIYRELGFSLLVQDDYHGASEAARLLESYGCLSNAVSATIDRKKVDTPQLMTGDLALWQEDDAEGLGVLVDSHKIVTIDFCGKLDFHPIERVVHGWAIDRRRNRAARR